MIIRLPQESPRHSQVKTQHAPAVEKNVQIFPPPVHGRNPPTDRFGVETEFGIYHFYFQYPLSDDHLPELTAQGLYFG